MADDGRDHRIELNKAHVAHYGQRLEELKSKPDSDANRAEISRCQTALDAAKAALDADGGGGAPKDEGRIVGGWGRVRAEREQIPPPPQNDPAKP